MDVEISPKIPTGGKRVDFGKSFPELPAGYISANPALGPGVF